jgi:hypothetical protein
MLDSTQSLTPFYPLFTYLENQLLCWCYENPSTLVPGLLTTAPPIACSPTFSQPTAGWGAQSWTKTFFFQYIGLQVILKLILDLKSTVLCGLDPWLTTIQF